MSSDVNLEQAEQLLNEKLNPDNKLTFDVYVHVSSSFDSYGDTGVMGASSESLLRMPDGRIILTIGCKIYRETGSTHDTGNGDECMTTIGAFLVIEDVHRRRHVCALTNCESTADDTDCYVKDGSRTRHVVGKPLMRLEGEFPVHRPHGTSDDVYFDGMLVTVNLEKFHPTNDVTITRTSTPQKITLRISDDPLATDFVDERVVYVKRHISGQPDGCIRSVNRSFRCSRTRTWYANTISLTPRVGQLGEISKEGDCGTLIGSIPGSGDAHTNAYGVIMGAYTIRMRHKSGERVKGVFTAAYPLTDYLNTLKVNYDWCTSVELLHDKVGGESLMSGGDSGFFTYSGPASNNLDSQP